MRGSFRGFFALCVRVCMCVFAAFMVHTDIYNFLVWLAQFFVLCPASQLIAGVRTVSNLRIDNEAVDRNSSLMSAVIGRWNKMYCGEIFHMTMNCICIYLYLKINIVCVVCGKHHSLDQTDLMSSAVQRNTAAGCGLNELNLKVKSNQFAYWQSSEPLKPNILIV